MEKSFYLSPQEVALSVIYGARLKFGLIGEAHVIRLDWKTDTDRGFISCNVVIRDNENDITSQEEIDV